MLLAVIALVVGGCSLLWNIISAIHSWRIARPNITIDVIWTSGPQRREGFKIIARNLGGAAVSITEVVACWEYKRKTATGWGVGLRSGGGLPEDDSIQGAMLPVTLQAHHSEEWDFDLRVLLDRSLRGKPYPEKFLIEINLGTGQSVRKETEDKDHYLSYIQKIESNRAKISSIGSQAQEVEPETRPISKARSLSDEIREKPRPPVT